MIEGGIGYGTFENHFDGGALEGNQSTITTLAVFLGGGARFTVWDDFSLAPTFGVVYAHSDNDFDARNDVGRQVVQLAGSSRRTTSSTGARTRSRSSRGSRRATGTCSAASSS